MARTIWEYFEERRRECEALSLSPDAGASYYEAEGSRGTRGRILMSLQMTERAFLAVSETVAIDRRRNKLHREEYAYYLIIDGQEYWSRDFDAIHGYHGHTIGHRRVAADRITFKRAVKKAWEIVSQEEELTGLDPSEPAD